jgi:hypothetical protein
MIFYREPILLDRDVHRHARLAPAPDVRFAAHSNSFLLAAQECVDAMRDYPLLFVGQPGGAFTMAALTGLKTDQNLFVTPDGHWLEGAYLPAFVRRYPFVLVEPKDGTELQIAVDRKCAWLDLTGAGGTGERLFTDEGNSSPAMDEFAVFLTRFHRGMQETRRFATELHQLGLLVKRFIKVKGPAGSSSLDDIWVVSEEALHALDAATTKGLTDKGYMAWIHLHLASLSNVQRLADLSDLLQPAPALPKIPEAPRPAL